MSLPWAKLFQRRCPARLQRWHGGRVMARPEEYYGRCDLRRGHPEREHALERGMIIVRWHTEVRWEGP